MKEDKRRDGFLVEDVRLEVLELRYNLVSMVFFVVGLVVSIYLICDTFVRVGGFK